MKFQSLNLINDWLLSRCFIDHFFLVSFLASWSLPSGTPLGCTTRVKEGAVPNEHGTWLYGRAGWCDGLQVNPWRVDVTKQVNYWSLSNFFLLLFKAGPINSFILVDLSDRVLYERICSHSSSQLYAHFRDLSGNVLGLWTLTVLVHWHCSHFQTQRVEVLGEKALKKQLQQETFRMKPDICLRRWLRPKQS